MSDNKCNICYVNNKNIKCNQCNNKFCLDCYINVFKSNAGKFICPYCRFAIGKDLNCDLLVGLSIIEIKIKAGVKYKKDVKELLNKYKEDKDFIWFSIDYLKRLYTG